MILIYFDDVSHWNIHNFGRSSRAILLAQAAMAPTFLRWGNWMTCDTQPVPICSNGVDFWVECSSVQKKNLRSKQRSKHQETKQIPNKFRIIPCKFHVNSISNQLSMLSSLKIQASTGSRDSPSPLSRPHPPCRPAPAETVLRRSSKALPSQLWRCCRLQ